MADAGGQPRKNSRKLPPISRDSADSSDLAPPKRRTKKPNAKPIVATEYLSDNDGRTKDVDKPKADGTKSYVRKKKKKVACLNQAFTVMCYRVWLAGRRSATFHI